MKRILVFSCAAALLLACQVHAGVNAFTPTGPDGGVSFDVEFVAGGALLNSAARGIYRSADGGANWVRVRALENTEQAHFAVNPANRAQVLFSAGGGLLRSTDAGVSWSQVDAFPPAFDNIILAVKYSDDGSTVWLSKSSSKLLYRSSDGGVNWTTVDAGLPNPAYGLAIDAANPQSIYLQASPGMFYSANGGTNLTQLTFAQYLNRVATSRTTANTALVFSNDVYKLYRTTNGGTNWTQTAWAPDVGKAIEYMQYVPGVAGKAYVVDTDFHFFRLINDGENWTDLGYAVGGWINELAFDPANSAHMFMAGNTGIFESTNDGGTWVERNRGLHEGPAVGVLASRAGAGAVYLKTRDLTSVYRRAANGDWTPVGRNSDPLLGSTASVNTWNGYYSLGVSQQDAQRLYMARDGKFGVSTDGGVNWNLLSNVPLNDSLNVSPVDDQLIFLAGYGAAQVRSTNGGQTWTSIEGHGLPQFPAGVQHFAFDPTHANVVYAASYVHPGPAPEASAVYKSTDGGANFSPTGWDPQHEPGNVWALVHDPVRANILYLCGYHGLYKTSDGGASWTRVPLFDDGTQIMQGPVDLVVDPDAPDVLYASAFLRPWLARSVDAGLHWDTVRQSDETAQFSQLALVPGTRGKIIGERWDGPQEYEFVARVAVSASAATVALNAPASTVLTVTNQSEFAVSKAHLTATLPASAATPTVSAASGPCALSSATSLSCDFGVISAKGTATVTVAYTPTQAGSWSASASVYETEDTTADNTVQIAMATPAPAAPPPKKSGGGGAFDYLLLALLAGCGLARRLRMH